MKEFLYKAADMMYASFLFLLTTFFTIGIGFGASLTAMLRVSYQVYNEKEPNPVTKIYFRSFKESFIESSVLYLLMLTIGIPLFLSWHYALNNNIAWLIVVLLVCSSQWLIVFIYGFNTISLFKTKNFFVLLKNVFILGNTRLGTNLLIIGGLVFIAYLVSVLSFFILLSPMLYSFIVTFQLRKTFQPYIYQFKKDVIIDP